MSFDTDTETNEAKSGKPVKRVRFSDEVENVYDFTRFDENSGSISLENESNRNFANSSIGLESKEFFAPETMKVYEDTDRKSINEVILKSLSDSIHENSSFNAEVNGTTDSLSDDIISQNCENSIVVAKEDIPFTSNCEAKDLEELITETMHMTISPTSAIPLSHVIPTREPSLYSSSPETNSKRDGEAVVLTSELKNVVSTVSRKRSLEGTPIEKQTSKLNTCLRTNNSEINSADELKKVVYNAWYKVKNEKAPVISSQSIPEAKRIIDSSQKTTSHDAFETWKMSKRKTKKSILKSSELLSGKTKEDIEESKMECT